MVDDETQSLAESLILHTEEIRKAISEKEAAVSMKNETEESRIFPVYRIKDIVFTEKGKKIFKEDSFLNRHFAEAFK